MAVKGVKKKEGELLSDSNIEKVIGLLEQEKPITKKEACEILNISYNTTRLNKIIEQYKGEQERDQKLRAAKRGKPAEDYEIQTCISSYLDGDPISEIAQRLHRPVNFVKNIIERIGVPTRSTGHYTALPEALPEQCIREEFEPGQVVWSAQYSALAIVLKISPETNPPPRDYKMYQVFVIETIDEPSPYFPHITDYGGHYADLRAFELGSLEHLKEYGVDVYKPLRPYFPKWLAGR